MDDYNQTFAYKLQEYLELMVITQRDLAYEVQVSPSTISKWASGEVIPHPRMQKLVLEVMNRLCKGTHLEDHT